MGEEIIGAIVKAEYGTGGLKAVGQVVSYCEHPTVTIVTSDGQRVNWVAHLCKVVTDDAEVVQALIPLVGAAPLREDGK